MAKSDSAIAFAAELFAGLGAVSPRRMFGVVGLFLDGVIFGLIDDERIYLKADETLKDELAAEGSHRWVYPYRKRPRTTNASAFAYFSLPDAAYDDPDEACRWARRALAVAEAKKAAKR
jgi:DNA transformation protein